MLRLAAIAVTLVVFCAFAPGMVRCRQAQGGELDRVRDEVWQEDDEDDDDDCDDDDGFSLLDLLCFRVRSESDPKPPASVWTFPRYPYADGNPGYLLNSPLGCEPDIYGNVPPPAPVPGWPWGSRLSAEYAHDFEDLSRIGLRGLIEAQWPIAVDGSIDYWSESLAGGGTDEILAGDANLLLRFSQTRYSMIRLGAGLNWLADGQREEYGVNVTLSADWFLVPPWVLLTEIDLGTIGDTYLARGRLTGGYCVGCVELFAGYEHLQIGNVDLGAAVCGVRIWN